MSTGSISTAGSRRVAFALLLLAVLVATLVACGDDPPVEPREPDADAADSIQRTLRQRARALVDRDPVAFGRTARQRDAGFAAEQVRYFDNLGQLPLGTVRFDLAEKSLEPDGKGYWAEVTLHLELEGYDVAPVTTRDRWRFAPTRDGRRYLLTSTTDARWEARTDPRPQPWDLGEIEVREGPGVLGIFDATTIGSADDVLESVAESRFDVRDVLPDDIEDPGGVVVYLLGAPAFAEALQGLPVSEPDRVDGATIPVPRDADDPGGPAASYRMVLSPGLAHQDEQVLDRLVRHELTHVAVGDHARGVPMWFNEGLAEYVSVRPVAPAERRLQTDALNLVAEGVDDLPPDDAFAGPRAEAWYAVSWWVCEHIAATYGEAALWTLLGALADGADQATVISEQLGTSTSALARAGVALLRRTYG